MQVSIKGLVPHIVTKLSIGLSLASIVCLAGVISALGQAGTLDTSFNGTGKQTTSFASGSSSASSVAIQSDGKIVAAGQAANSFALARYNTDGTLDTAGFGTGGGGGGKVVTSILAGSSIATSVAIQSDGKIVAAGIAFSGSGPVSFALARYNTNGSLDATFGGGTGIVTTTVSANGGEIRALAIQADGRIVVAGYAQDPTSSSDFAVARYNTDGTPDATFNGTGLVITNVTGNDQANAVAIQSDGKIVAAGQADSVGVLPTTFAVLRYNTNGTLDGTFGSGGKVTTAVQSIDDEANGVAIDSSNRIVVAGATFSGNFDFAVARYSSTGVLDGTFGSGGKVITPVSAGAGNDFANAIKLQTDGRLIVAGTATNGTNDDFVVVRYTTTGTPDGTFGSGGKAFIDFGSSDSGGLGNSVAIDSSGKIVVVGNAGNQFGVARLIGVSIPTAAGATVIGHVTTASGAGIQNVVVTLTDAASGDTKQVRTKKKGEFQFNNVRPGVYIISVSAKKYSFSQPSTVVTIQGDVSDIMFVATK
jgi:uncharacterized delta-60 repeat protein